MIPVQLGRGGWVSNARLSVYTVAVVMCLVLTTGCSKKKPTTLPGAGGAGATGIGEQGLGTEGGSLEEWKKGRLGASGGPLTDIHFDLDEFTIRPQDGEVLRSNARWLGEQGHQSTRVQVEGHCDERGSEEFNIALGAKRAQAAKEYLETLGVAGDRISTISYGKELPLCNEHDESCWAQNRRAHFVVQ